MIWVLIKVQNDERIATQRMLLQGATAGIIIT